MHFALLKMIWPDLLSSWMETKRIWLLWFMFMYKDPLISSISRLGSWLSNFYGWYASPIRSWGTFRKRRCKTRYAVAWVYCLMNREHFHREHTNQEYMDRERMDWKHMNRLRHRFVKFSAFCFFSLRKNDLSGIAFFINEIFKWKQKKVKYKNPLIFLHLEIRIRIFQFLWLVCFVDSSLKDTSQKEMQKKICYGMSLLSHESRVFESVSTTAYNVLSILLFFNPEADLIAVVLSGSNEELSIWIAVLA